MKGEVGHSHHSLREPGLDQRARFGAAVDDTDETTTVADTPATLESRLARAFAARERVLDERDNQAIIDALAASATRWLQPATAPHQQALANMAATLSMSADMLGRGLELLFSSIDPKQLRALVDTEVELPAALEQPVRRDDGSLARLGGPPLVFHLLAGNVPGLAVPAAVACLLARSVCIVRDSARQPYLTAAFVETLAGEDALLADMIVPVAWRAGERELERLIARLAPRVELFGSDATLSRLAARYGDAAVVEHGTRLSVGLVPGATANDAVERWADGFAEDAALYEGKGCLSPHVVLVEGDSATARHWAEALARALAAVETRWPRQAQGLELEALRREFIGRAELAALASSDDELLRASDDAWCIHLSSVSSRATLTLGPGLRCLRVVPVANHEYALRLLRSADVPLACVGVAMDSEHADFGTLVASLRSVGATLVCTAGRMQAPPIAWQQDGRRRLGDLLEWHEQPR